MSALNPYLKQYQKNSVETASPEKLLIMLYDGAIQFLNKAKLSMEEGEIEQTHNNLTGCQNIILEFMSTLDMKQGGDLAQNLYRLYEYYYNTLVQANLQKDIKKVEEVLKHLKGLRETWQQAINIANAERRKDELLRKSADSDSYEEGDEDEDEDGYQWPN